MPAEYPHENKLHHVAVEEEKLCTPVSLCAIDGLHAACWGGRGGVGEENVFEGTELAKGYWVAMKPNLIGRNRRKRSAGNSQERKHWPKMYI